MKKQFIFLSAMIISICILFTSCEVDKPPSAAPTGSENVILAERKVAATPTISPNGGYFTDSQQVTLSSTTAGAAIYYTIDDGISSMQYSSAFTISATATVKAIAVLAGYIDSSVATATFTKTTQQVVAAPTITPDGGNFNSSQLVTLSSTTVGATIYYTTDGTEPGTSSTQYAIAFTISADTVVKAIAVLTGYIDSSVATATFTKRVAAANPNMTPTNRHFEGSQAITLTSGTVGATIHYTTDGTTPTTSSTQYSAPFTITADTSVKAIAVHANHLNSSVTSALFQKLETLTTLLVEGGTFTMGEVGIAGPTHSVTLSSFYMGKYEVTQEQWEGEMGNQPSANGISGGVGWENRPVDSVSWYDAVNFCNVLSIKEGLTPYYTVSGTNVTIPDVNGKGYRLPTEAEWEYAAKGGTNTASHSYAYAGSNSLDSVAWNGSNSGGISHNVGGKTANALALHDMSGNVWEWCWDWLGDYSSNAQTDPQGSTTGSNRILRGELGSPTEGCWSSVVNSYSKSW